mmetsp:Transcript_69305/g.167595  ORF Transcript_69305/g.167595 Transcript_69305/m.167595 type:complete len:232 (-) Transcript_69305:579-1274(-)
MGPTTRGCPSSPTTPLTNTRSTPARSSSSFLLRSASAAAAASALRRASWSSAARATAAAMTSSANAAASPTFSVCSATSPYNHGMKSASTASRTGSRNLPSRSSESIAARATTAARFRPAASAATFSRTTFSCLTRSTSILRAFSLARYFSCSASSILRSAAASRRFPSWRSCLRSSIFASSPSSLTSRSDCSSVLLTITSRIGSTSRSKLNRLSCALICVLTSTPVFFGT